jgi:hypothetical protein
MSAVWMLLTTNMEMYRATVVNMTDDMEPVVDEDGNTLGYETLFYRCFDFIEAVLIKKKLRPMIKQNLAGLLSVLIFYMQMTEDQARDMVQPHVGAHYYSHCPSSHFYLLGTTITGRHMAYRRRPICC